MKLTESPCKVHFISYMLVSSELIRTYNAIPRPSYRRVKCRHLSYLFPNFALNSSFSCPGEVVLTFRLNPVKWKIIPSKRRGGETLP